MDSLGAWGFHKKRVDGFFGLGSWILALQARHLRIRLKDHVVVTQLHTRSV